MRTTAIGIVRRSAERELEDTNLRIREHGFLGIKDLLKRRSRDALTTTKRIGSISEYSLVFMVTPLE